MRRAALLLAGTVLATAGCGNGEPDPGLRAKNVGPIAWDGQALLIPASKALPNDWIVGGRVKNESLKTVKVAVKDLEVETADGERVQAALGFIDHYAHGIFPPTRRDQLASNPEKEAEDRRMGRLVTIKPGQSVPLTFAWRQPPGARDPVRIRYLDGYLPIPK